MSHPAESPFTPEKVLQFFEKMAGVQFIDAATGLPAMEAAREGASMQSMKKSSYEPWPKEQDESLKLRHRMGEI
jgi:hypothetical protein